MRQVFQPPNLLGISWLDYQAFFTKEQPDSCHRLAWKNMLDIRPIVFARARLSEMAGGHLANALVQHQQAIHAVQGENLQGNSQVFRAEIRGQLPGRDVFAPNRERRLRLWGFGQQNQVDEPGGFDSLIISFQVVLQRRGRRKHHKPGLFKAFHMMPDMSRRLLETCAQLGQRGWLLHQAAQDRQP